MSGSILKDPIINEIEFALRADSGPKRTKVLMGVTDLFIGGATNYSDSQSRLFDNVLIRLIERS